MIHTKIDTETQVGIKIFGKIDGFFNQFKIATSLHQCGIRKRHGHSVRTLILAIFTLPFVGENFFRGIATNDTLAFGKDAAYGYRDFDFFKLKLLDLHNKKYALIG